MNVKGWISARVSDVIQNPKVAVSVTGGTTATTGTMTAINWIPANIGLVVTILGAIGTIVVIWVNVAQELRNRRKHALEMEKLELDLEIKRQKAKDQLASVPLERSNHN